MAKRKKIIRTDLLPVFMNAGKAKAVRGVFRAWRETAVLVSAEQWRLFYEAGGFNKQHPEYAINGRVGTDKLQMIRWQVVGQLDSFIENRANDFRRVVHRSSLPADLRHQLHAINRWKGWFSGKPEAMKDGTDIPDDSRRLARSIMRGILRRHAKPCMKRINMMLDQRAVRLGPAESAGRFPLWLTLKTTRRQPGKKAWETVRIPLGSYPYFETRIGDRVKSVQMVEKADGRIYVGAMTDVSEVLAASRAAYLPLIDNLGLDFGLRTLFASSAGDLVGRNFLAMLQRYDRQISALATYRQGQGLKTRSPRYIRLVQRLRGFIETTVNASFERLVAARRPAHLTLERLDFRRTGLSRRMNRILSVCGRGAVAKKLADLEERLGITSEEVNPAYTSQTCSSCGHVDPKSRDGQRFCCTACGFTLHADVNAARNIKIRRSDPIGSVWLSKANVLAELVTRFSERRRATGAWACPADSSVSRPKRQRPVVTSSQRLVVA